MIEIDFLPVGDGSRSGDAIAVRVRDDHHDHPKVIVIDGGYADDGEALVEHIRDVYETSVVDLVIGTHSDSDHINGLKVLVDRLTVKELAVHRPWLYTDEMARAADVVRLSKAAGGTLMGKFERSLAAVSDLTALAADKGIPIVDPFAGFARFGGSVAVLGPTKDYYCDLLPSFRSAPTSLSAGAGVGTILRKTLGSVTETIFDVAESLWVETLTNSGTTVAENNASVITMLTVADERFLLTGDAGIEALERAADFGGLHYATTPLQMFQAPHHGSKHNVGPDILDRLLGPKNGGGSTCCIASAAQGSQKHPSRRVTNALTRRSQGAWVTNGRVLTIPRGSDRNFGPVAPEPFHPWVEDEA
jgi:beta-lactamase superfamily II metal-dependent hydrolase